jgi:hypothetical protein
MRLRPFHDQGRQALDAADEMSGSGHFRPEIDKRQQCVTLIIA